MQHILTVGNNLSMNHFFNLFSKHLNKISVGINRG